MQSSGTADGAIRNQTKRKLLRVLFFVEGFTDIRFVTGLSEICDLTMIVPARHYAESGLKDRVRQSRAALKVIEIAGGRIAFQARSFACLWSIIRDFDVVLAQEVLRGAANATLIGALRGVPVVTYMGISPLEYFQCRRQRRQIGPVTAAMGEATISALMYWNARLATRCLTMGPYLREVASRYGARTAIGLYYGVDTNFFRPANEHERRELRSKRDLPIDKFIIFLASRISHEKDPETVLRAVSLAREAGIDAIIVNLSGGYRDFIKLAEELRLPGASQWVLGRPAAHPTIDVADYFRLADVVVQASLVEGLGLSPLEALACGTPVVATCVGGMAKVLPGFARLTPRRDHEAMAREICWIASHSNEARQQALRGRLFICREWSRTLAFSRLLEVFHEVVGDRTT
jgi:glycosyltransferase involved in cell wall biosynthesis